MLFGGSKCKKWPTNGMIWTAYNRFNSNLGSMETTHMAFWANQIDLVANSPKNFKLLDKL